MGLFGSANCFLFHFGFKEKANVAVMCLCDFVGLFGNDSARSYI